MQEYYFLFILAFIWICFATVQDLRKREVANWLNFSLLAFALSYRLFYSLNVGSYEFFLYSLIGTAFFFAIGNGLYYSKAFGGGDTKLLISLGAIFPFEKLTDFVFVGFGFIAVLFSVGLIYTILYSLFLVMKNKNEFKKSFKNNLAKYKFVLIVVPALGLLVFPLVDVSLAIRSYVIIFVLPYLFVYLKSVDVCMIKKVNAASLTEGDWLESSVKVGGKIIRKSVHGLSWEEILLLRKYNKSVVIKEGIPFVPVFLIAIMVFFYLISRSDVILSFSLF